MSSPPSSPAPPVDASPPAPDSVATSKPQPASSSNGVPLQPTSSSSRAPSAPSSPPSAPRPESVEDLIALSQQLFQSPEQHNAPDVSAVNSAEKDGSESTPRQLTPSDERRIQKNKEEALKRKRAFNERMKLEQANRERVAKVARTTVTSAQPSQFALISKPVTFLGKTHRLCKACGGIPTLQKRSVPNICRDCNRAFICFVCAEIGATSIPSSSKHPCSSCGRVPFSQQAPRVKVCPTCNRAFVCFKCMMPI